MIRPLSRRPASRRHGGGGRARKLDELVAFKVHGVTRAWIRQQAAGYGGLTAEQLAALRLAGFAPRRRK